LWTYSGFELPTYKGQGRWEAPLREPDVLLSFLEPLGGPAIRVDSGPSG